MPEGAQLVRLPNGQLQIIQPAQVQATHTQQTNQGLILMRSNNQVIIKLQPIINLFLVYNIRQLVITHFPILNMELHLSYIMFIFSQDNGYM